MKKLDARVSISAWTGAVDELGDRGWSIRIEDPLSGCTIVEVMMDQVAFAEALSNLAYRPAVAKVYDGPIGQRRETKAWKVPLRLIQSIPVQMHGDEYRKEMRRRVEVFLASETDLYDDGWRLGATDSSFNDHRVVGKEYGVSLVRYVNP